MPQQKVSIGSEYELWDLYLLLSTLIDEGNVYLCIELVQDLSQRTEQTPEWHLSRARW